MMDSHVRSPLAASRDREDGVIDAEVGEGHEPTGQGRMKGATRMAMVV